MKTSENKLPTQQSPDFYYQHGISKNPKKFDTHCHNTYEIIFFVRGNAGYVIEDRKYTLKKYDLIITRPSRYHNVEIESEEEYERYNILVRNSPQLVALLDSLPERSEVVNCSNMPTVVDCFKKTDVYKERFPESVFFSLLNNLLEEVCYNLILYGQRYDVEYDAASPIIRQALVYINDNLFSLKDIDEVCDHLFISKNYFFKLFKEQINTSPKKYITAKRLLQAQKLLSAGEKPTSVYEKCGFNNYISFYSRYVDFFGYPPSQEKTQ